MEDQRLLEYAQKVTLPICSSILLQDLNSEMPFIYICSNNDRVDQCSFCLHLAPVCLY